MTLLGIGLGLLSAVVFGVAAVVQASAVRGFDSTPDGLRAFVTRSVGDLRTMAVIAAYLVGFVLHAAAIWLLPLYLAQAMVAMSLPVTAIASRRVEDDLGRRGWVSVVVVTAGLVMLSLGAGTPGEVVTGWAFVGVLWACVAVLAVVSLRASHLPGPVLGLVAGLGYAASAIAVRGVGTPVTAGIVVAALAVPTVSVVAFWLYSLGMSRSAVPSTTGALIVAQTFVPSAVGVALLGDGVRAGWWPVVAVGFALSTAGAVALGTSRVRSPAPSATR